MRPTRRSRGHAPSAAEKEVLIIPTGRIAVRQAEKLSLEPHPIFGRRGRQIIDSLVADLWHQLA